MAKQNVINNLENKIQAKDIIVPTGEKQGKTLEKYLTNVIYDKKRIVLYE